MNKKQKIILSHVHKFVKRESKGFGSDDVFSNHILSVKNYALKLAKQYNANEFVVALAAYLHDIYRLQTHNHEIHEIRGAEITKEYLKKFDISKKEINLVCKCILHHRGSKNNKRKSIEEKIVACADAMDHINRWIHMFYRCSQRRSFAETVDWMNAKMDRGYLKITLPLAERIIRDKYLAAKLSLKNIKAKVFV
jgi:putative nucleotidyltransferase with HDIG domain